MCYECGAMCHNRFRTYIVVIALVASCGVNCTATVCDNVAMRTDPELKDIFIGRCQEYQNVVNLKPFCGDNSRNCTLLWQHFSSAFIGSDDPCNISADAYHNFITAADIPVDEKQMFYSGLYGFAQKYSDGGKRFVGLEDTFIGYLVDGLKFCDSKYDSDGVPACPRRDVTSCPSTASTAFWVAASRNFAKKARGHVYALLNATRQPIFKNFSFFAAYEVPELRTNHVTHVSLILINDSPKRISSPCIDEPSLQLLYTLLSRKNITVDCKENPRDLYFLYCMEHPTQPMCSVVDFTNQATSYGHSMVITFMVGILHCVLHLF